LLTNEIDSQFVTIQNTGESDLVFKINPLAVSHQKKEQYKLVSHNSVSLARFQESLTSKGTFNKSNSTIAKSNPAKIQSVQNNLMQSWQLLYTDPDEPGETYNVKYIYGNASSDEIFFKLECYQSWSELPYTYMYIYIDTDQDTATGLKIDDYGYGWQLGLECYIRNSGDTDDGLYAWNQENSEFIKIGELTTRIIESNSNEIILGVDAGYFEHTYAVNLGIMSYIFDDEDYIPDMGMGHITFPLSPPWLRLSTTEGIIPAGGDHQVTVTFDAAGLFGGDYRANMMITSNDPVTPLVVLPAHLSVTGRAVFSMENDMLDFGTSFVGYSDSASVTINNIGTDVLEITDILSGDAHLTFQPASLAIPPLSSDSIKLYLHAENDGAFVTTLTFSTNDPDSTEIILSVISSVLIAPDISVLPDSITMTLDENSSISDTLTIFNTGGSDLIYSIIAKQENTITIDEDFNAGFPDSDFLLDGNAFHLPSDGKVYLTTTDYFQTGGIFYREKIQSEYLQIRFDFEIYWGSGADGMALVFLDSRQLGNVGGGLGFYGTSGWGIEFDTWANDYDETYNHIALANADETTYVTNNDIPELDYTGVFTCEVLFDRGHLVVYLENQQYGYARTKVIDYTFVGMTEINAYIGFTAATGDLNNNHTLDNLIISGSKKYLTVSPMSGTVVKNSSMDISLNINSVNLSSGAYKTNLCFYSNDPDELEVVVPVYINVETTGIEDPFTGKIPKTYVLFQNYPNPFNPVTHIRYGLPKAGNVKIELYNILGQRVETLLDTHKPAGYHLIDYDGSKLATGLYFYRIEADKFQKVKKMLLIK
jgi:hypothetical protein